MFSDLERDIRFRRLQACCVTDDYLSRLLHVTALRSCSHSILQTQWKIYIPCRCICPPGFALRDLNYGQSVFSILGRDGRIHRLLGHLPSGWIGFRVIGSVHLKSIIQCPGVQRHCQCQHTMSNPSSIRCRWLD